MVELDAELVERVARWCAEAGRQAATADIRRALEPLEWDELLAVRALLADPPPARPLGPHALADMARGAPADVAAEREREGRYGPEPGTSAPASAAVGEAKPKTSPAPRRRPGRGKGVVIRRARDMAPPPPSPPPTAAALDELFRPRGRAILERLIRAHGARRAELAAALAEWRRSDGTPPRDEDLSALLDHHGLGRAFERRERDEILHALRAAGGVRAAAAARLGLDPAGLDAALERLGARGEAERIREARRADLRARATLSERVRLLLADEARLRDLGLLAEFEADLRARLPEHVRALRAAGAAVAPALSRSLSLTPAEARSLAARFGLDVKRVPPPAPLRRPSPPRRPASPRRARPRAGKRG